MNNNGKDYILSSFLRILVQPMFFSDASFIILYW